MPYGWEHPLEYLRGNGQADKGWIDLLLKTAHGWLIIDHKAQRGSAADLKKKL
jgi:hypothetical protein